MPIEWADYYQRLSFSVVDQDVVITAVFEDENREWQSSVVIPSAEFVKLLAQLDREFSGPTKRS